MKIKEVFIETLNAIRLRSREFSAGFFLCVFRHGISSSFVLFGRWRSFAATGDEHFLSVFVVTDNSIHVVASVSSYFIVRLCFLFHAQQTTVTKKKIVLYYRFWTFSVPHEWLWWQRWHCVDDNDAWTEQRPCTHWRRATRSGKSRNNKQKQKHPMISIAYYYFIVKYFWILIMCSMCHWWKWIYYLGEVVHRWHNNMWKTFNILYILCAQWNLWIGIMIRLGKHRYAFAMAIVTVAYTFYGIANTKRYIHVYIYYDRPRNVNTFQCYIRLEWSLFM